jgi:hypothetical protein
VSYRLVVLQQSKCIFLGAENSFVLVSLMSSPYCYESMLDGWLGMAKLKNEALPKV